MSKAKHIPYRLCVACRNRKPQSELIRLYKDEEGLWTIDQSRKAGNRGAWLCKDSSACHQPKILKRFFRNEAAKIATQLSHDLQKASIGGINAG